MYESNPILSSRDVSHELLHLNYSIVFTCGSPTLCNDFAKNSKIHDKTNKVLFQT